MTRSRASAKAAGTRTERAIADYLQVALDDDRIDRRVKTGNRDRGDIGGVRVHGQRLVVECKDVSRIALAEWVGEAEVEAENDDALAGLVIAKRRGTQDVGKYYVVMTVDALAAILTGERPA